METIKYFNPNNTKNNSRKGVIIFGKCGFTKENMRLAKIEANLVFRNLNKKKPSTTKTFLKL